MSPELVEISVMYYQTTQYEEHSFGIWHYLKQAICIFSLIPVPLLMSQTENYNLCNILSTISK